MKKLIYIIFLGLTSVVAHAQMNWQKGGINALPAGSLPILGTTYNAPLNIITNSVQRMTILGGPVGGPTTGFVGIGPGFITPTSMLHIHDGLGSTFQMTDAATTSAVGRGFRIIQIGTQLRIAQQEADNFFFHTGGTATAANSRMIITGIAGGTQGFVGIGNGFTLPQSRLHINDANNSYAQWSNTFTAATATDGLKIGVDATTGAAQIIQQESAPIIFYSSGSTFANTERVRITYGNGPFPPLVTDVTRVAIDYGASTSFFPIIAPQAMLHMGRPTALAGGWRDWMDVGMFLGSPPPISEDFMYVGLKKEPWGNDAMLTWGMENV